MTPDIYAQQRNELREMCASLRILLGSEQPVDMMAILQEVGNIECEALVATGIEFQAAKESMRILLRRLRHQGIISADRWADFSQEIG
jgi:hypothetical protein